MPKEPISINDIVKDYVARGGSYGVSPTDVMLENQVRSELMYGTLQERAAQQAAQQTQQQFATLSGANLGSAISELLNFPGVADNASLVNISRGIGLISPRVRTELENEGKKLISQNLTSQINKLSEEGINDDNIETYNKIWEEIGDYSKKALQFQSSTTEELAESFKEYDFNGLSGWKYAVGEMLSPGVAMVDPEREEFLKQSKRDISQIEAVSSGIQKKLNEIKAPYLGQKFLQQNVGVDYGAEANAVNYAKHFNSIFNKDASWMSGDQLLNTMKMFAYQNANPGDPIYSLDQKEINNLLESKDLSESQRVTAKLLEDVTLNGLATTFAKQAKDAADRGDQEALEVFKTSLNNISDRMEKSKKDYNITDYGKYTRAAAQFFIQAGRSAKSMIPFYSSAPDAASLGNDIRFGPAPIDINNDGKLDVDKYGNMIMSNQFTYVKKDGSFGTNFGAIPELSSTVIGQMAPILAVDFITRGIGGKLSRLATTAEGLEATGFLASVGRTATAAGKSWEAANAWKGLRIADRAATFGLVTGSVYDSMYADELRWTKDKDQAANRAWGRSMIEGLTEAIGAPEIGMFGVGRFPTSAKAGLLRMFSPEGATVTSRLGNFLTNGAKVGVLAGKQTFTESLEEEMSLYGNYLYGKMLKAMDSKYEKEDEFEAKDIAQTFLDSFVGMAPYSLLGVGIQQAKARKSAGVEHQVLWDMANNPEYYKAQIKDLLDKKKFTPEQAARAVQTVTESRQVLDEMPNWKNLKDLRTLLSDKDAQMKYFHDTLYRKKLQQINYDELNDEQKDALKNARLHSQTNEVAEIILGELAKKETLTPEEEETKAKFQGLLTVTSLSSHQFTAKEKKKLVDLGVLKEEDLTNSKEDLLKELESVDKSILKSKEKVDQFMNMSDAEKESVITRLFDEQIASVENLNDPSLLATRLKETKEQLAFIESIPTKYQSEQIGRQKLVAALEEKLGQQIAINPNTGRNNYTETLLSENPQEMSLVTLQEKRKELQRNKSVVNEADYELLNRGYIYNENKKIQEFNSLSPEKQEEFLVEFLKEDLEVYKKNKRDVPDSFFELDALKDRLTLKRPVKDTDGNITSYESVFVPNITPEVYDKVKKQFFDEVAEEKKTPEEKPAEGEEEFETRAFNEEEEKALSTREIVDESGRPQTNIVEQTFNKLNKTKKGNATLSREYFIEKMIAQTNAWILRVYGKQIPAKNFNQIVAYIKGTISGQYDNGRVQSEAREIIALMPAEIKQGMQGILDVVKFARKYYQVNKRRRTIKESESEEQPKPETRRRPSTEPGEELEEDEEQINSLQRQANIESAQQEKELVERQNAVIQLQTPSSTYGFEVTRSNKLSEDPAIQRNADILRFLTTQDYGALKVRITSRSNFLRQLATAQGVNYDDFIELLNKAHEEYKSAKGNAQQKAEKIAPLLQELNSFFGENFFEQTFDETRGVPELIYMVEKNGANLSDPILTIVNAEGDIQSFDGYPFYTNIDSNPKIITAQETQQLPYWENILGSRVSELEQFKPVVEAVKNLVAKIKSDSTYSEDFSISRVTQGTYITETEELVPLDKSGLEITEEDVKVIRAPKQTVGTEVIAGVPGQAFVVANGVTSVLLNDRVDPLEAEALAMMVFDKTLREQFFPGNDAAEEADKLKKHIAKVLNIFEKDGKKVAFSYDEETQNLVPFIPGVSGKQLTQQELTDLLQKLFYNVQEKALDTVVPRFSVQEGEVVQTAKQSYLEFIKSTNKIYMSEKQPAVRRNQRIIFDMKVAVTPPKQDPKKVVGTSPQSTEKGKPKNLRLSAIQKTEKTEKTEEEEKKETEGKKPTEEKGPAQALRTEILKNAKRAQLVEETLEDGTVDSYYLIDGVRYERVSSEIPFTGDRTSFGVQRALTTGSLVDRILRDVFAGRTPPRPTNISPASFKNIVSQATEIYNALKQDYVVMTEQMTVWNEQAKVAGTIDMVLINKKTGEVSIVDFKTSQWVAQVRNKIMGYSSETQSMSTPLVENPKPDYVTQQNSYGLMFFQQYGVLPELNIMYIRIGYEGRTSERVTEVSVLTEDGMPIITIPTDKTKVIPSLQSIEKAKPVTKPVTEEAPAEKKPAAKAPVSDVEAKKNQLENLKSLVNSTKDITSKMDDIFKILDEDRYKKWQDSLDTAQLEKDLKDKIQSAKSEEEIANIVTKYLLPKFIDAELARELYKEMKAGKMVTEMTPAEQQVADKYITPELRASVDAELDALEAKPETKVEKKVEEKKEEGFNPFAAGLTAEDIRKAKEKKEACGKVGVGKKKKDI